EAGPAALGTALLAATQLPVSLAKSPAECLSDLVFVAGITVIVAAVGQTRRRRLLRRAEIAGRLANAEQERRFAARAERERLARDLHDVAGHHLSAVVVHASAAARLADTRPELALQSLDHAAATGRDVLAALTRLVDVVGEGAGHGAGLPELLPQLADGLTRLGVPVSLRVEGRPVELRPPMVDAVYRIVQESLTNAMRYGGGEVDVRLAFRPGELVAEVANPLGSAPPAVHGSGRGIKGMRSRAAAVGGTLTAGPAGPDAWSVRATVPLTEPAAEAWSWLRAVDLLAVLLCAVLPLLMIFAPDPGDDPLARDTAGLALVGVLAVAHCVPVAWRRRAPWGALSGLLAVCLLWAAGIATGMLRAESVLLWLFAWISEAVVVYAIAVYTRGRLAWVVAGLATGVLGLGLTYADPELTAAERPWAMLFAFVVCSLGMALLMLPFWCWGLAVRRRRSRSDRWERDVLDAVTARTDEAVRNERYQIALGLRGEVLAHTARLVREAERPGGRLAEVATEGRAALAGMRKLLDVLDEAGS
ncbi:MAG: histidine kinase, partial [Streptosporangiaceae bacterium]